MANLVWQNSLTIAFGNVTVGSFATASIGLLNTAPGPGHNFVITANNFTGSATFTGGFSPIPQTVPDDDGTAFGTLTFTPSSATSFSGTFNVPNSGLTSLSLTGTGVGGGGGGGSTGEAPGLVQSFRRELIPVNNVMTGAILLAYYDTTNFNDATDSSTYIFRAEDIIAERVPTIRRVILTYIDLGVVTIGVTLTGSNDNSAVVTASTTVSLGNATPTGALLTKFIDLELTAFRPQLTITRAFNAGPLQISTVMATGTIERQVTL